jgi:hypothetical protein
MSPRIGACTIAACKRFVHSSASSSDTGGPKSNTSFNSIPHSTLQSGNRYSAGAGSSVARHPSSPLTRCQILELLVFQQPQVFEEMAEKRRQHHEACIADVQFVRVAELKVKWRRVCFIRVFEFQAVAGVLHLVLLTDRVLR